MRFRCLYTAIVVSLLTTSVAQAQSYVDGIDVSRWQTSINWTSVLNSGTEFAFIKATEGVDFVDPWFHTNFQNAAAAGVLAGPYHYARPDSSATNPLDPVNEANDFLDAIVPYYETGSYLPPVLDVEEFSFTPPGGQSLKNFVSGWVQDFSDTVLSELGVRPIIYTSKSYANTYFTNSVASQHDLWMAWWKNGTSNPPTPSDAPSWDTWKYWQWTATGSVSGVSGNVDRNLYNGTRQQLEAELISLQETPGATTMIADFEVDEGYFGSSILYSGSTSGVGESSYAERVTTEAQEGNASQELFIDGDAGGWFLRHLAGIGTPGSPGSNREFDTTGYIGFWLKTDDEDVSVSLALDAPSTADRGIAKQVIADGQWHLYQWSLEDDDQWEAWVAGDGIIDTPTATIDSIQFFGSGQATVYLDAVMHNPLGSLLVSNGLPGDFNGDGTVNLGDYLVWRNNLGAETEDVIAGNGDNSGTVDAGDYTLFRLNFGNTVPANILQGTQAVPEPATALGLLAALGCGCLARRRQVS